jgi:hypothetical protein
MDAQWSNDFAIVSRIAIYLDAKEYFKMFGPLLLHHGAVWSFLYVGSYGFDYAAALILVYQQRVFPRFRIADQCKYPVVDVIDPSTDIKSRNMEVYSTLYEVLLFAEYTFTDRVFPTRMPTMIPLQAVVDILEVLLSEKVLNISPAVASMFSVDHTSEHSTERKESGGEWSQNVLFPYLSPLLRLDVEATVHVLSLGIRNVFGNTKNESREELRMRRVPDPYSLLERLYECINIVCDDRQLRLDAQMLYFTTFQDILQDCHRPLLAALLMDYFSYLNTQRPLITTDAMDRAVAFAERQASGRKADNASAMKELPAIAKHLESKGFFRAALPYWKLLSPAQAIMNVETAILYYKTQVLLEVHDSSTGDDNRPATEELFAYIHSLWAVVSDQGNSNTTSPAADLHQAAFVVTICRHLVSFAQIDIERTKTIALSYLQDSVDEMLTASSSSPYIQYQLLRALDEGAPSTTDDRDTISSTVTSLFGFPALHMMKYIQLLAIYAPQDMFEYLVQHEGHYSLDECIEICRSNDISDAYAYLLTRNGQPKEALQLLLADLTRATRDLVSELCCDPCTSSTSSEKHYQEGDQRGNSNSDAIALAQSLESYARLKHSVRCIVNTCKKCEQSAQHTTADTNTTATLWYAALDHFIDEKAAVQQRIVVRDTARLETALSVVGNFLLEFLDEMLTSIPPREVFLHITTMSLPNNHSRSVTRMRDFRSLIRSMIETENYALMTHKYALRIVQEEHHKVYEEKVKSLVRTRTEVVRFLSPSSAHI